MTDAPKSTSLPPSGEAKAHDPTKQAATPPSAPAKPTSSTTAPKADTRTDPGDPGDYVEGELVPNPDAPYAPPGAPTGVDENIARDGSGTKQVEPFADEYPADARIEPQASQLNPRNQTTILEPYLAQPYDPDIITDPPEPPVADAAGRLGGQPEFNKTLLDDIAKADKSRHDLIKETREAFRDKNVGAGTMDLRNKAAGHDRPNSREEADRRYYETDPSKPKPTQLPADNTKK